MNEKSIRILIFISIVASMLLWQLFKPAFNAKISKRTFINLAMHVLNIVMLLIILPLGLGKTTSWLADQGLSSKLISQLPYWWSFIIGILILDLAIYFQHWLFHRSNLLWRLHQVHHCDRSMDFSTGVRFHPIEIFLSTIYKIALILFFGIPPLVVIVYEVVLNSMALFNHSNIYIPTSIEKFLRLLIVTPNMHYPHHSPKKELVNRNYGNFLSVWDRLFKTYTNVENVHFGLKGIDAKQSQDFWELLKMPFRDQK